jgi:putative pyoverdin transport system ATP-binding/permease protein
VLVISHDDRYFHLADRLVRMENGQLTVAASPSQTAAPSPSLDLVA